MNIPIIDGIIDLITKVIDKAVPDANAKAQAKTELIKLAQAGEFKELEMRMSAIIAEAQSQDKWTSRARPAFMYVIYLLILTSIPFAFIYACNPDFAEKLSEGFGKWLSAIPEDLYWLFGSGYLGYTFARSVDKKSGLGKK